MDAIGADQGTLDLPVEVGSHALQIGPPGAFGLVVGMTDVVPDGAPLSTNGTNPRHNF
jgi:hypothetical protein